MKRNLLILVIVLLIVFIVNSCGDDEKKSSCECNPKQHNEGESCCIGNGCNCIIILNCVCPVGTFHLVGENCRGSLNCECELNVKGTRIQGIAVTDRDNAFGDITTICSTINTAINGLGEGYSAETLENNVKEIVLVEGNSISYNVSTKTINVGAGAAMPIVRAGLRGYLDEVALLTMFKQFDNYKSNILLTLENIENVRLKYLI